MTHVNCSKGRDLHQKTLILCRSHILQTLRLNPITLLRKSKEGTRIKLLGLQKHSTSGITFSRVHNNQFKLVPEVERTANDLYCKQGWLPGISVNCDIPSQALSTFSGDSHNIFSGFRSIRTPGDRNQLCSWGGCCQNTQGHTLPVHRRVFVSTQLFVSPARRGVCPWSRGQSSLVWGPWYTRGWCTNCTGV